VKFLKLFTILPMSEIAKLAALQGASSTGQEGAGDRSDRAAARPRARGSAKRAGRPLLDGRRERGTA